MQHLHLVLAQEPPKANCHHPKDTHASYEVDNKLVVGLNLGGVVIGTTVVIVSIVQLIDEGINTHQYGIKRSMQNDGMEDYMPHPNIPLPAVILLDELVYHVDNLHGRTKGMDGEHGLNQLRP
jgi:hypothetical protein